MPLGQFDERRINVTDFFLDSTATPNTPGAMGLNIGPDQRFDVIQIQNSDTIPHTVGISIANFVGRGLIAVVDVPAGAGYAGVPPVDFLALALPANNHYLLVAGNDDWFCWVGEAIGAGKIVGIYLSGGFF